VCFVFLWACLSYIYDADAEYDSHSVSVVINSHKLGTDYLLAQYNSLFCSMRYGMCAHSVYCKTSFVNFTVILF